MDFSPTKKQEEAFKKVAEAIRAAKKAGLVFYGKSACLVAYTKQADNYVDEHGFENCLANGNGQIPNLSQHGLLADCGADDFPCFMSEADRNEFS